MIQILFFCLLVLPFIEIEQLLTSSESRKEDSMTLHQSSPVHQRVDYLNWMAGQCLVDEFSQKNSLTQREKIQRSTISMYFSLAMVMCLTMSQFQPFRQQLKKNISLEYILVSKFWEIQLAKFILFHYDNKSDYCQLEGNIMSCVVLALNILTTIRLFTIVKTSIEKTSILAYVFLSILSEFWFVDLLRITSLLLFIASPLFQLRLIFINKLKLNYFNYKWNCAYGYVFSIRIFFQVNRVIVLMQISSEVSQALKHFAYTLFLLYILFIIVPLCAVLCRVACMWMRRFLAYLKGAKEQRDCIVCLKSMKWYDLVFQVQDMEFALPFLLVRTKCNHIYHIGCLSLWFSIRRTCPLDQQAIPL